MPTLLCTKEQLQCVTYCCEGREYHHMYTQKTDFYKETQKFCYIVVTLLAV